MSILFIFIDGLGLGKDDPISNPLCSAKLPTFERLLQGRKLILKSANHVYDSACLYALDATLEVPGLPQSATGQGVLVTGKNIPAMIDKHYGPKPNRDIARIIQQDNIFKQVSHQGKRAVLLNAYPESYFAAIDSGRRIYSTIPLAATSAGIRLKTTQDLISSDALSADITGRGWRDHLGITETPILTPQQAGKRMAEIAISHDFSMFEFWLTDFIGHRQNMAEALRVLNIFDQALGGLLDAVKLGNLQVVISSDHGNLEDLSTRRHTYNPVPLIVTGSARCRDFYKLEFKSILDLHPLLVNMLNLD
jgi:hypothetical protein